MILTSPANALGWLSVNSNERFSNVLAKSIAQILLHEYENLACATASMSVLLWVPPSQEYSASVAWPAVARLMLHMRKNTALKELGDPCQPGVSPFNLLSPPIQQERQPALVQRTWAKQRPAGQPSQRGTPMQNLRRHCFRWCWCQVARVDQARHSIPIKPDIAERVERKSPQNDAPRSDRHACDGADELDAVTFFQLWCRSRHMLGRSINDAPDHVRQCHRILANRGLAGGHAAAL